jgi:hypothetical protein
MSDGMRHTQLTAEGGLMTVEQRRVLLYLDALRLYWVGFEGRAVSTFSPTPIWLHGSTPIGRIRLIIFLD